MNFKNLSSSLLISLAIIVAGLIVAGAIIYSGKSSPGSKEVAEVVQPSEGGQEPPLLPPAGTGSLTVTENDHIRGDLKAPVTIVEFSDFQCPFCSRFHPTVQQVLDDYAGQVRWVYKHFPLDQIHPQARPAAEASECAAEQDKFWEFSDGLFENQSRLGESFYPELAGQLGLNTSQFENCVSSRKYKDEVESDYQEGIGAGVRGTPASFVNGKLVSGAVPLEQLKAAVEEALANLQ
ncbi:MAG: DsbA family protein [Candidatus Paceibacterales bacterium]